MRTLLKILAGIVAALILAVAAGMVATRPEPPKFGSQSAARLKPGYYAIASVDHTFVDGSRPTPANRNHPASPERRLEATIWYPRDSVEPRPLVVYSHGFMSLRIGGLYLAEYLASYGYIVVAADYPLTNYFTPGGPNLDDAINQPGDVSFILDTMLGWDDAERPFDAAIDPERIGVAGLSLGGLTSTLLGYHPRWRDERISAVVSIAGPTLFFTEEFYRHGDAPFLMIAGTADAMVAYEANAAPIPETVGDAVLVTIEGGSHAGFSHMAGGVMRLLGNPDAIGCRVVAPNLERDDTIFALETYGDSADGIVEGVDLPLPCSDGIPAGTINAVRQQFITKLAVLAFFESRFADAATVRIENTKFLLNTLPREFPEVRSEGPAI